MSPPIHEANADRAALAREVNERIRAMAGESGDDLHPYTFVCECGCWSETRVTLREYDDSDRVLRAGHGSDILRPGVS